MPFMIELAMPFKTERAKKNRKIARTQASHVNIIFEQMSTGRKKFMYVKKPVSISENKSENGESGRMLNIFITITFKICIIKTSNQDGNKSPIASTIFVDKLTKDIIKIQVNMVRLISLRGINGSKSIIRVPSMPMLFEIWKGIS